PNISDVSAWYMTQVEMTLTERLFAAKLGIQPLFFRPPYAIDQEPDVADQVRPIEIVQEEGYTTVGSKIDPNDWQRGRTADDIANAVFAQASRFATAPCRNNNPPNCGNVILLHDGGGDRSATVKALPRIIEGLRSRGFEIVSVGDLLGMTRGEVMPELP